MRTATLCMTARRVCTIAEKEGRAVEIDITLTEDQVHDWLVVLTTVKEQWAEGDTAPREGSLAHG